MTNSEKKELFAIWDAWAQEPNHGPGENRIDAVNKVREWLNTKPLKTTLQLPGFALNLTSLPEEGLPDWLEKLDLHRNRLTKLPEKKLPLLRVLNVSDNMHLGKLPENMNENMPSLQELEAINCGLKELPETMSHSIKNLDVHNNKVRKLPKLPPQIETLRISKNRLEELTEDLVQLKSLVCVRAAENKLKKLPEALSDSSIEEFDVSENELTELPNLPKNIKQLFASKNKLKILPSLEGLQLKKLYAAGNQLNDLPPDIYLLNHDCHVYLPNNPLPERVIETIRDTTQAPGYKGPVITTAAPVPAKAAPSSPDPWLYIPQ